jgi:ankyrin repeat protein
LYDIFQAAGRGDVLLIRRLLAEGADVNARKEGNGEYYSYTPLHIAVFKGHMKASIT